MNKSSSLNIIAIGIDLGTTNSEIAANKGISGISDVEIIKNSLGDSYTPSVFGIDKSGNEIVGKRAYEKLFKGATDEDSRNYKAEVKRLMGTGEKIIFDRTSKEYSPEYISAEIIKNLKNDLLRKYPQTSTIAAVVTVPAYFDSLQNEATKRAAMIAGFSYVVLLQEPIAAAMAYGFGKETNENWIVYDLGGGTFDVALIASNKGILKVLDHGGDNFLGGKDIDNKLVREILLPTIEKQFPIKSIQNDAGRYKSTIAKLKATAETAKIDLSTYETTTIEIDCIGKDDHGREIYISFPFTRADLERLIFPTVERTISITREVIQRSGVMPKAISKIVLVGGPTQIPYIRSRLQNTLGIDVDASVDPLTTVAKGACVFGLGEKIPEKFLQGDNQDCKSKDERVKVTLNYEAMTSEEDEMITGSAAVGDSDKIYYVKISSDSGHYSSEKIRLKNGKFIDTVAIEKGKTNVFWIYLMDDSGNQLSTYPDSFSITHGLSVSGAPIPHDIGVIYVKKSFSSEYELHEVCERYFQRGSILPLTESKTFKTARNLISGENNMLPIKVYEGDSPKPEHNLILTTLNIAGGQLPYNLPTGTDIDISISINRSREVSVEAYLPSIDLSMNARADVHYQTIDSFDLAKNLSEQKTRADSIKPLLSNDDRLQIDNAVRQIEMEVTTSDDIDTRQKADRDLREFMQMIDRFEGSSAMSRLQSSFNNAMFEAKQSVADIFDPRTKRDTSARISLLENEGNNAIQRNDQMLLERVIEQLEEISLQVNFDSPEVLAGMLAYIQSVKSELLNPQAAEYHVQRANMAIQNNDIDELRRHIHELLQLLPREIKEQAMGNIAGIMK